MSTADHLYPAEQLLKKHAGTIPNYQSRPGQVQLCAATLEIQESGGKLCAQGPCGCGKCVATLAPSFEAAVRGERTIVAISTLNLTDQVMRTEVPRLQKAMPNVKVSLLRGRRHYACLHLAEKIDPLRLSAAAHRWLKNTLDGDMMLDSPLSSAERDALSMSSGCLRRACPHIDACHYEQARARFREADIGITTHAMLAICRALEVDIEAAAESRNKDADDPKPVTKFPLLGPAHHLVIDEADKLPHALRHALTVSRKSLLDKGAALEKIAQRAQERRGAEAADFLQQVDPAITALRVAVDQLFAGCAVVLGSRRRDDDAVALDVPRHRDDMEAVSSALAAVEWLHVVGTAWCKAGTIVGADADASGVTAAPPEPDTLDADEEASPRDTLDLMMLDQRDTVVRYERGDHGREKLETIHLPIAHKVRTLMRGADSVTYVSATLAIGGRFDHFVRELELTGARTLDVASPFDFEGRTRCVLDTSMPVYDFRNKRPFWDASAARVKSIIETLGGGVLVLFSSNEMMDEVHLRVAAAWLPYQLHKQPRAASERGAVIEAFRQDEDSCLFGVDSCWTGLDVPGRSLRAVVIVKMPVTSQSDIMMMAYDKMYGPNMCWELYDRPTNAAKFGQGAGRLMRCESDYGMVFVLDGAAAPGHWRAGNFALHFSSLPRGMKRLTGDLRDPAVLAAIREFYERFERAPGVAAQVSRADTTIGDAV